MGIGLQYSRSRDPKFLFKRGLSIGLVAIFLNVFRYLVPSLVGYAVTGNYDKYISKLPYRFFGNDILQFACLAMILMSLFLYLKLNPYIVFVIALVMNMASMLVNNIDFGNMPVNIIMGHFIGVEDPQGSVNSDFPFSNGEFCIDKYVLLSEFLIITPIMAISPQAVHLAISKTLSLLPSWLVISLILSKNSFFLRYIVM